MYKKLYVQRVIHSRNIIVRITLGYCIKNNTYSDINYTSQDRKGSLIPIEILLGDNKELYRLLIQEYTDKTNLSDNKLMEIIEQLFNYSFLEIRDQYEIHNDKYKFLQSLVNACIE